jgi:hypothetical protein
MSVKRDKATQWRWTRITVGRWLRALSICTVGALILAGVAGAANSTSFTDRAGDAGKAPDITQLDVSNDDAGTITIRLTFAGGRTLGPADEVAAVLDLDQNPDTGTVYYGTEAAIRFKGNMVGFARAAGNGFTPVAPPPSLQATSGAGFVTFAIAASDLGLAPDAGFNIAAFSVTSNGDNDFAPDIRTFNYQLGSGPPPPVGADTRAPVDHAFASRGVHGKVAQLVYAAQDGRGVTADTIRVYRHNRLLKTIRISLGDASPFYSYYAPWRVPRKVHGRLRFCVRSTDAAGNKSNQSCARLVIR